MSRTYRALTTLALSLALVGTTAAVAGAAEDQNDRLLRGIEASQAERTQAAVEQLIRVGGQAGAAP